MDYYQLISSRFQEAIEGIAASVDSLAEPLARASETMVQALLADRKIIVCGNGADGALAQLFACNLSARFENDRPALPAISLNSDGVCLTGIAEIGGINDIYARQLRSLGQPGDVLLCINSAGEADNQLLAVQAAHERNMIIVALSNTSEGEFSTLLQPEDTIIRTASLRRPQLIELHTMTLNCLCELIEKNLFGTYQD